MSEDLQAAVLISAIGMGVVFGVILLLWGLMTLVVRAAAGSLTGDAQAPTGQETSDDGEATRRRAAAVVAAVTTAVEHERAGDTARAQAAAAAVGAYIAGERDTR